ncbi:AAA family ATPase [Flavobacterium piscisymbiosum]|uniref:AAA family ATPase n=1 Tax=Flavobacterium piscisymbiosum TaxID=2893753 RepID=A0ABS8MKF9_9FLAO|nr:AAA family ATPase [Flavobacterium sp. F-30]MCC9065976.1 AAA family ATPase [Flavobacterium sp. F-30]
MIKKIEHIKDFGIYKNFFWVSSTEIKDFNLKNLFYGWNYSGKTTLSRIFSSLRDKQVHDSYVKGSFRIVTDAGTFDSSNLQHFPYDVLVFNSDYIKDNLSFSFNDNNITDSKTIFFEVGDNAKYEKILSELRTEISEINGTDILIGKKARFLNEIDEFDIYDKASSGKFTTLAREIKDDHFLSLINFTKANLKPIVLRIKNDTGAFIIKDKKQLSYLNDIVKVNDPKEELNGITIDFNYDVIIKYANRILETTPEKNTVNKILDTNYEIYDWVKKGKDLNKPNTKCLFCDNTISEDRYNYLIAYFNSQASLLKKEVDNLKFLIEQELNWKNRSI